MRVCGITQRSFLLKPGSTNVDDHNWPQTVLTFWFEELTKKDWFTASTTLDKTISDRFAALHARLSEEESLPSDAGPDEALARVIVLDQFSRNLFRGSAKAFATDALALHISKQAIDNGFDRDMTMRQKQFLYMPLMHSENMADQRESLSYFSELGLDEHAIEHSELIERFGRFPHRNELLGRQSTPEEIEHLKSARRFGQ